jgi:8-oxo-dGTP diphosphatase
MTPPSNRVPKYCRFCGALLVVTPQDDGRRVAQCATVGCVGAAAGAPGGPELLVLAFIFAENHMLLLKRGIPPYAGRWAPPGGFVEPYETTEAAAIRETAEEVGIRLELERLIPFAISSLSLINQVYVTYLIKLDRMVEPQPCAPEALDARWFPERAFPMNDIWEPSYQFDMNAVFERLRTGRFEFYQRTDRFLRVISDGEQVRYLEQRDTKPRGNID